MGNGITLYTSLPPSMRRTTRGSEIGATYQAKCLRSWKDAGFDIVSVNDAAEIAILREKDLGVEFMMVPRGRPRIVDLLAGIIAGGQPIAGIINADVVFLKGAEVAADLVANARGSLVMLERINIAPDTMAPTLISCFGFDAFLFDTRNLPTLKMDAEVTIGETWWDYCFPLAFHRNGGQLKRPASPLLLHLDHPQGWDKWQYFANGRRIYETYAPIVDRGLPPADPLSMDYTAISDFSTRAFEWIRASAAAMDPAQVSVAAA